MLRIEKNMSHRLLGSLFKNYTLWEEEETLWIRDQKDITLDQIEQFAEFIKSDKKIKRIKLYEMSINDEQLQIIVSALKYKELLTEFSITSPWNLSCSGLSIVAIADLLRENSSLTELRLIGCQINHGAAMLIAQALSENRTLKKLDIGRNPIGSEAATSLIEAINVHGSLSTLDLTNTQLDDNIEKFSRALEANFSLTDLALGHNDICEKGALTLAIHLSNNATLKKLTISKYKKPISPNGIRILQKLFQRNYWLDKLELNEQTLLRTPEERALQIERESPAIHPANIELRIATLKEAFNTPSEKDLLEVYLQHFEDVDDAYQLSYVDLYNLIQTISTLSREGQLSTDYDRVITLCFNDPYFFEVFLKLDNLSLINENNFKTLYLLSDEERMTLQELFNSTATELSFDISDGLRSCLELLLPRSKKLLFPLFKQLMDSIPLNRSDLIALLSLSELNISRLHETITDLINANMLDNYAYKICFDRITAKKPKVTRATIEKKSRKEGQNAINNSQITINDSLTIYLEHNTNKEYVEGSFGRVKRGLAPQCLDDIPTYGVKKFFSIEWGKKYAVRGVKFNNLLGREAYFFQRKGLISLVSTWHSGKALIDYHEDEIKLKPLFNRFLCIISGLSDIEKLHSQFYIHGDIKPENFIVDFLKNTMLLIDFDGTRKKGSGKNACYTESFLDCNSRVRLLRRPETQSFYDDIYAMGKTISDLFPELYNLNLKILKNEASMVPIEYAVILLVTAMTRKNCHKRCTSSDALSYCHQIIDRIDTLDKEAMKIISEETISPKELSVENILRGQTQIKSRIC